MSSARATVYRVLLDMLGDAVSTRDYSTYLRFATQPHETMRIIEEAIHARERVTLP